MILSSLCNYYQRKCADPEAHMAPPGFEWKDIPFIVELNEQGYPVQIEDTREIEGKKKRARAFLVQQGVKKTSGVVANLFWDNAEYVLGIVAKGNPARVVEQHRSFIARIEALPASALSDNGVEAVLRFFRNTGSSLLQRNVAWQEIIETNPNITFRLQGDVDLICQRPAAVSMTTSDSTSERTHNLCLVTGKDEETERLHAAIKGVWGAQTSGANIVSFNLDAFNSYGKKQGSNAPIGKQAAFAYTTALNHLLHKDSTQRLQIGDTSTVFWTDRPVELETSVVDIFGESPKDDPDRNTRAVASLYKAIDNGVLESDEGKTSFFVLGLAPNAARIAIRFWHHSTVAHMSARIRQHFDDLALERAPHDPPYPSLFRLLVSVATLSKADNVPPNLGGELMRSILEGLPYPQTLLSAAVRRIRAEHEITYIRAALMKACLNRAARYSNSNIKEELTVSLDESNTNAGYRLGRLFAVLEKIQEEANPGINAKIRDRFYGAASSTPVTVFSTLLKLKNHHISKLENRGRAVNLEKRISEIMDGIDDFPAQLHLADQGRFAIGYYHQRQNFFKKTDSSTEGASS